MREARDRFFLANEFGADGGYDDAWAEAEFGPVLYRVPNLRARAEALRVHDLHHLVTGYATDWRGESEISAWELGSGWGRYPYAWIIAFFGFFTGLVAQPATTLRAFVRGRRSRNLYARSSIDGVLERSVRSLRQELGVPPLRAALPVRFGDVARFGVTALLALSFAVVAIPVALMLVGLGQAQQVHGGLVDTTRSTMGWLCSLAGGTCPLAAGPA